MNIIVTVSEVLTQKQQEVRYDNIKFTQPGYQYVRNLATCIVTTDIDTYKTLTYEFEHMNGQLVKLECLIYCFSNRVLWFYTSVCNLL